MIHWNLLTLANIDSVMLGDFELRNLSILQSNSNRCMYTLWEIK